jgi:hypothetical protein
MALKDWEQEKSSKLETRFSRKDNIDTIYIFEKEHFPSYFESLEKDNFIVTSNIPSFPVKFFKTKSQAIKFAKAYMRKH